MSSTSASIDHKSKGKRLFFNTFAMYCFGCMEQHENVKTCSRCKINTYCSVACQTSHWPRHKRNCLPADCAVHQLFHICAQDIIPPSNDPVWWQFGFASVSQHHGDVYMAREGLIALQILLGVYQAIRIDVSLAEDPIPFQPPGNTIGMSMKMLQKAYKANTLDDLLHRYISNSISSNGYRCAKYLYWWRQNQLIIGPTIPTSSDNDEWQRIKEEARQNIYTKYYAE